jgi:hypothetical protein
MNRSANPINNHHDPADAVERASPSEPSDDDDDRPESPGADAATGDNKSNDDSTITDPEVDEIGPTPLSDASFEDSNIADGGTGGKGMQNEAYELSTLFEGFVGFFAGFIASINCVVLDNVGMLLLCFIVGFICIVSEASGKLKLFSASYHIIFMSQIFMSENVKKIDVKKIVHYNR